MDFLTHTPSNLIFDINVHGGTKTLAASVVLYLWGVNVTVQSTTVYMSGLILLHALVCQPYR